MSRNDSSQICKNACLPTGKIIYKSYELDDDYEILYIRVRTGPGNPGKSWNFRKSFSRPGKSWNSDAAPGNLNLATSF